MLIWLKLVVILIYFCFCFESFKIASNIEIYILYFTLMLFCSDAADSCPISCLLPLFLALAACFALATSILTCLRVAVMFSVSQFLYKAMLHL